MCNHLCNIKNTSARAVQLSAFACEVSPKSVSSSHLPHTAVHIHHFDWSVRQSGILRVDVNLFFFWFTCSRRLCTVDFTFAPKFAVVYSEFFFSVLFCVWGGANLKVILCACFYHWMYFMLHWVLSLPHCWRHRVNNNNNSNNESVSQSGNTLTAAGLMSCNIISSTW